MQYVYRAICNMFGYVLYVLTLKEFILTIKITTTTTTTNEYSFYNIFQMYFKNIFFSCNILLNVSTKEKFHATTTF